MEKSLREQFERGIQWNSLESLVYQTLFCTHQISLYTLSDARLYGATGVFFSVAYLAVGLSNLGFSSTIAPFIAYATQSKNHFKQLFGRHILFQLVLVVGASFIAGICSPAFIPFDMCSPVLVSIYTACLIILEGIKRIGRTLLQAAFLNKITSLIHIVSIVSYCMLVWIYKYTTAAPFTFTSLIVPWISISLLSTSILLFFCMQWYTMLPTAIQPCNTLEDIQRRTHSARWSNAVLSLIAQLFSRNALIALCSAQCGVETVAPIKIITYVLSSITAIFRNIFQKTSSALLGWSKDSPTNDYYIFTYILQTITCHPISYILILSGILYCAGYISLYNTPTLSHSSILMLCMLCITENIQIMYESFFVNKERANLLIILYSVVIACCLLAFLSFERITETIFLSIILSARLSGCCGAGLLASYLWGITLYRKNTMHKNQVIKK